MIDVKELRVGNRLYNDGVIVTIDARSIFDIWDKSEKYSPIPLTPELLEKFGFVKDPFGDYERSISRWPNSLYYALLFSGDYLYLKQGVTKEHRGKDDVVSIWNKDVLKTFYLHQLQNLFYSLTGEELEVKL